MRKGDNGKQFLYYELALKHPVKEKMGIPVSSMLSEEQSLPVIYDWLHSFIKAVKKRFGHSRSVLFPKMIISDQAMVFILAALKEFNGETMELFLKREWDIVNGNNLHKETKKLLFIHVQPFHEWSQKVFKEKGHWYAKPLYLLVYDRAVNELSNLTRCRRNSF